MTGTRPPAPAARRAIAVMRALGAHGGVQSLSTLARLTDGAKSSTLAVLEALTEAGFVRRGEDGYRLGFAALELGSRVLADIPAAGHFARICVDMPTLRRRLVRLATLEGTDIVYLARHEGDGPDGGARVGDRLPAASTAMGRALLARFSDDIVRGRLESRAAFARLTAASTTDTTTLVCKLRHVRDEGFAVEVGEVRPGVVGVGLCLPHTDAGAPRLAVGVSVAGTSADAVEPALVDALTELAARLTDANRTDAAVQPAERRRSVA